MKIYLCGPEVFLPNALEVLAKKMEICRSIGWEGLSPLDNELPTHRTSPHDHARAIYAGNLSMMNGADAVVANITPFRGPHMDPGTAFEIGYMVAQGKPVMLYTQDSKPLAERVMDWSGDNHHPGKEMRDKDGYAVENFGLMENLMIESGAFRQSDQSQTVVVPPAFQDAFVCEHGFVAAVYRLHALLDQTSLE